MYNRAARFFVLRPALYQIKFMQHMFRHLRNQIKPPATVIFRAALDVLIFLSNFIAVRASAYNSLPVR